MRRHASAGFSAADFGKAYLLNLDIAGEDSYSFEITGITVGEESVAVAATLARAGKIAQNSSEPVNCKTNCAIP